MDSQSIYRRRWVILSVLIVGLLAIVIDNTVLNVAMKTIAEPRGGLGASQSQLEWAINSYTLVFAGLLFTFGVIGDKVGRKRMLMIGLALFGIASLLSAYAQTPEQLIFARAAMGLGGAAVMPQTLSIISNVFEPAERPRAIGLWATAVGIGIATGPVLGGLLLDHFWWGSVFLINVPVTVVGIIAAAILVPESRNREAGGIDYVGVLLSIAGLVLLVYGIVQGGDSASWLHLGVLGPIVGGLAVLAVFAWYEARIQHPSLDVRLFRDRRLSASIGARPGAHCRWWLAGERGTVQAQIQLNPERPPRVQSLTLAVPPAAGSALRVTLDAVVGWLNSGERDWPPSVPVADGVDAGLLARRLRMAAVWAGPCRVGAFKAGDGSVSAAAELVGEHATITLTVVIDPETRILRLADVTP